jgi:TatD DNase family protein
MDVHARCMQMLQKSCNPEQPIHIHCFSGDAELVKEWMDTFSRVHFGFTGAVEGFSADQIAGLRSVPMNRLLIETDSPYMKPGRGAINTPAFIGDVATVIASKLQVTVRYLLKETVKNCRRLYNL